MTGINYFINVLTKRYADFEGRSRRSEYWYYTLFNMLFVIGLISISWMMGSRAWTIGIISYFFWAVGTFIPGLAVATRRLHDTNKSGWWLLIAFIPIGAIVLLVFMASDGDVGQNQFGYDPKREEENDFIADNLV